MTKGKQDYLQEENITQVIITYEGKEHTVDISKPLPTDFLEKDFSKQEYVEVRLVRAIAKQLKNIDPDLEITRVEYDDEKVVAQ